MAQRIKIQTLKTKLESMIVALDGPPDKELNENTRLLDDFETISNKIKKDLQEAKGQLEMRKHSIKDKIWYSSNERTEMDEEIKTTFTNCEAQLSKLRTMFKEYKKKNKEQLTKSDILQRTTMIDKLRKNLNLLKDEFNSQQDNAKKDQDKNKLLFKKKNNKQ